MPPRSATKKGLAYDTSYRRSKRLASKNKSAVNVQSASLKGKPKEQKSATKENPSKRRRVMKMEEVNERASQMKLDGQHDFSAAIERLLRELCPDLDISEDALADMNTYLNHVFERLARQSAILPLGRCSDCMAIQDVETAVHYTIKGDIGMYCIAEGRRAVKRWNKLEYEAAYK